MNSNLQEINYVKESKSTDINKKKISVDLSKRNKYLK
jgi:hypothetical protein